jgi:hypothetical protein
MVDKHYKNIKKQIQKCKNALFWLKLQYKNCHIMDFF